MSDGFVCTAAELDDWGPTDEETDSMMITGIREAPVPEPPAEVGAPAIALIRAELTKMLEEPAFGVGTLNRIKRFAEAARLLLGSYAPETLLPEHLAGGLGYDLPGGGMVANPYSGGVFAASPPIETFGAKVTRELVEGLKSLQERKTEEPLSSLIDALAHAREERLDAVADAIEKRIQARLGADVATLPPVETLTAADAVLPPLVQAGVEAVKEIVKDPPASEPVQACDLPGYENAISFVATELRADLQLAHEVKALGAELEAIDSEEAGRLAETREKFSCLRGQIEKNAHLIALPPERPKKSEQVFAEGLREIVEGPAS